MTDEQNKHVKDTLLGQGFTKEQVDNATISFSSTTESNIVTVSVPMYPKQFIRQVLINELDAVVKTSPWLGFICMSSGIEFLGKCIDTDNQTDWNAERVSSKNFNDAIKKLDALSKYRPLLSRPNFNLYSEFRCGLVHACAPKGNISLSHGTQEMANLVERNNIINFNADELFVDFKAACEEVINMDFINPPNKMNVAKIYINCTLTNNVNNQKPRNE